VLALPISALISILWGQAMRLEPRRGESEDETRRRRQIVEDRGWTFLAYTTWIMSVGIFSPGLLQWGDAAQHGPSFDAVLRQALASAGIVVLASIVVGAVISWKSSLQYVWLTFIGCGTLLSVGLLVTGLVGVSHDAFWIIWLAATAAVPPAVYLMTLVLALLMDRSSTRGAMKPTP
jgi:predicted anti-sigma-YlaC factor YlaD